MSKCHCGNPADLLVRVLKTADEGYAEATYAVCYDHVQIAIDEMEQRRAEIDGIIKIRNAKMSAYKFAWFLIEQCQWVLHTPEWAVVLRIARLHDDGEDWVLPEMVQHNHGGGSIANTRELLTRPRVTDARHPLIQSAELERDGKRRTYYRLAGWEGS